MIAIEGLHHLLDKLDRLDLKPAQRAALGGQAERMASDVRSLLSRLPGQDHSAPWLRSGELRASIDAQADEEGALIGSSSQVAVYQEMGTRTIPPRPFLAPIGAADGMEAAQQIAHAVVDAIKDALR